jgi:putative peptidoglycan lipid II flippase
VSIPERHLGGRHAIYLSLVSAAARAPGFVIPLLIAALFGAGPHTDAYFLVYSAVLLIGGTLGQGVEVAIVPHAARVLREAAGAISGYLNSAARNAALAAAVAWIVAVPILFLVANPILKSDVLRYAIVFTPMVLLWCAAGVYSGTLISQWLIASATGSMLWRGVGALLGFALAPIGMGLGAVAIGLGAGEACRLWWLRRHVRAVIPATPGVAVLPDLSPLRRSAAAQVLAGSAGSVVPLVERLMAAGLGTGSISHLEYATRLLIIPTLFFDGALGPLLLARWTARLAGHEAAMAKRDVYRPVFKGILLAAACAVILALFALQFVRLVLGHGRFGAGDAMAVAGLLRILAIGFVGSMGALLLERLYLADARNQALAVLSIVRAAVRLITAWVLLSTKQLLAFGVGYSLAEWLYLGCLASLAFSHGRR